MSDRRLPYYTQISYKKDGEWTKWIDVLPDEPLAVEEFEYFMLTQDELKGWQKWCEGQESMFGYRTRMKTNSKKVEEIKYLDDFFNL